MTERHLDLLQKHRELQKGFDDTLEMNIKLGSENWKFEKENEQLKNTIMDLRKQIDKMKNCSNCNGKFLSTRCSLCKDNSNWELVL